MLLVIYSSSASVLSILNHNTSRLPLALSGLPWSRCKFSHPLRLSQVSVTIIPLAVDGSIFVLPAQIYGFTVCTTRYSELPIVSIFVYDTLVCLAISYRLAANSMTGPNLRSRLMSIISGEGLYSLSKSLMRSGQLYYLYVRRFRNFWHGFANMQCHRTTIIAYFVYLGVKASPALGSSQIALLSGYIAFTNMMACRVFRGVALGGLEDSPTQLGMSSTRIADVLQLGPLSSSRRTDSKVKDDLA